MKASVPVAIRVGTASAAVVALLPYIGSFFVIVCMAGALAAVWFAVRKRNQNVSFKDGANLGFCSAFYGLLLASTIYDLIWKIFNYKLWSPKSDLMIKLFTDMVHDAFSPSIWLMITWQIIIAAICAGAIGAPSGLLFAKIFQTRVAD